MRRFFSMLRKEFLQIRRDSQSMKLLFLLPILQTLILGYAMTRDVKNIALGMVDLDRTPASAELTELLAANQRFSMRGYYQSTTEARKNLLKGEVLIVVVIPRHFSYAANEALPDVESMEARTPAHVQILVDGQDAATAGTAAGYAAAIIAEWGTNTLLRYLEAEGLDARNLLPLELHDRILFNPELTYSWYMVPGMIVLLMTMTGALLTSFSLVRERENGTLEQLLVTPVHPLQVLLGKAIPYWILGQFVFMLALFITGWWYGIPLLRTNFIGLYFAIAIYALTSVSLGILVSTLVHSQQQALFLIWFFLVFFILTSGFMLPFESMPLWMQNLTEINAVRHFLYMVRALVLRGVPPLTLLPEYAKLLAIGVTLFGTSVLLFRRRA